MPVIVDKSQVFRICVDDFALKRRQTYGTVMIDWDTHRIIDMIPSRVEIASSADASEEMKCLYDTANRAQRIRYAHAKRKEGLTIQEIAYLLHSGCRTVEKYLAIPEDEIPEDRHTLLERQHQEAIKQKEEEAGRIRQLYESGMCIAEIARATHHTTKTVKSYLDPNFSAVSGHYDLKRRVDCQAKLTHFYIEN